MLDGLYHHYDSCQFTNDARYNEDVVRTIIHSEKKSDPCSMSFTLWVRTKTTTATDTQQLVVHGIPVNGFHQWCGAVSSKVSSPTLAQDEN